MKNVKLKSTKWMFAVALTSFITMEASTAIGQMQPAVTAQTYKA